MTFQTLPSNISITGLANQASQGALANTQREALQQQTQQKEQAFEQSKTLNALKQKGLTDPKARAIAIQLDPAYGKQLQDYQAAQQEYEAKKAVYWGSQAAAASKAPLSSRPIIYKNLYDKAKNSGENVDAYPLPSEQWTEAHQETLDYVSQSSIPAQNQLEMKQKQQKMALDERIATADIDYKGAQADKTRFDLNTLRRIQDEADEAGLSPESYKKTQEIKAKNIATKAAELPQVQANAKQAVKLLEDILSHPGMESMVGAKNIFSGAATRYIPFKEAPIVGSDAAGFQAKFEQLQGKNFLQAFETLKGGGQITEVEGKKATDAISSMQLSTSEKEFKAAAQDLAEVINDGVVRAGGKAIPFKYKREATDSQSGEDSGVSWRVKK
jgi:hypothetical protein